MKFLMNFLLMAVLFIGFNAHAVTLVVQGSAWSDAGSHKVTSTPSIVGDATVTDNSVDSNVGFNITASGTPLAIKRTIYKSDNTVAYAEYNEPGLSVGSVSLYPKATCDGLQSSIDGKIRFDVCAADYATAGFSAARVELLIHGRSDSAKSFILQVTPTLSFVHELTAVGNGQWKLTYPFSVAN